MYRRCVNDPILCLLCQEPYQAQPTYQQQAPQQYQACSYELKQFIDCAQNQGDLKLCEGFSEVLKQCKFANGEWKVCVTTSLKALEPVNISIFVCLKSLNTVYIFSLLFLLVMPFTLNETLTIMRILHKCLLIHHETKSIDSAGYGSDRLQLPVWPLGGVAWKGCWMILKKCFSFFPGMSWDQVRHLEWGAHKPQ